MSERAIVEVLDMKNRTKDLEICGWEKYDDISM